MKNKQNKLPFDKQSYEISAIGKRILFWNKKLVKQ